MMCKCMQNTMQQYTGLSSNHPHTNNARVHHFQIPTFRNSVQSAKRIGGDFFSIFMCLHF